MTLLAFSLSCLSVKVLLSEDVSEFTSCTCGSFFGFSVRFEIRLLTDIDCLLLGSLCTSILMGDFFGDFLLLGDADFEKERDLDFDVGLSLEML